MAAVTPGSPATWTSRSGLAGSSSSRMAAAAAGAAPATGSSLPPSTRLLLGTLLVELLTPEEDLSRANVFNVRPLAARLTGITGWLRRTAAGSIPGGHFGASTGAAAALWSPPAHGCRSSAIGPPGRAARALAAFIAAQRDARRCRTRWPAAR